MPTIIRHTYMVLEDVRRERDRQEQLRREGRFPHTCASPGVPDIQKLPIVMEELGEVAQVLCEVQIAGSRLELALAGGDGAAARAAADLLAALQVQLRTELVQLGAVAVAWAEALTDV